MANFFTQISDALESAEGIYGVNYTLSSSLTVFRGIFTGFDDDNAQELGEFDETISATIVSSKKQFTDAGVNPKAGLSLDYDSKDYRVLRVNSDDTSFEFILKKI